MRAHWIFTRTSLWMAAVAAAVLTASAQQQGWRSAAAAEDRPKDDSGQTQGSRQGRAGQSAGAKKAAPMPSHRVIVCYFHRTQRCPTCKRISAYIEEAIRAGFAREIKQRRVAMTLVDFQDRKNARYTKAYKIKGPTLVIIDVRDGKVAAWKPAPKVWSLVKKKDEFFKYVQKEVRAYLEAK